MADAPMPSCSSPSIAALLLEHSPAGIALVEGEAFVFAYVNEAFQAIAPDRPMLRRPFEAVWPEVSARLVPLLRQVRETRVPVELEDVRAGVRRRRDGPLAAAWWTVTLKAQPARGGEPPAVAIHTVDRTSAVRLRREADARRRAEDASVAAGQRAAELDAVLDSIADGLVISSREGLLERANATALRLLGELPPGSDWLQGFVARDEQGRAAPGDQLPPARALRGEVVHGEELRLEPRAGRGAHAWLSVSAAPIRDERGAIRGVVTTFGDISRLRELQERQSDLLRAISHDLRTPLTVILTQAQMLQRRPDDPATVVRRAESVRTSAQRMAAMIEDLVDLVRLEAGLVKLTLRPVPLAPFAAELRDRLRGTLAVERLRLEVPEALPAACADPPRLERILVNLVSNALKYSPPESEITLAGAEVDGQVQLTVADHGPGIAADELERVFERFYRSPSATRREGLGLGLYVTRLLVEAHGGRIRVESEIGRGAAFHVLLPRAVGAAVEAEARPAGA